MSLHGSADTCTVLPVLRLVALSGHLWGQPSTLHGLLAAHTFWIISKLNTQIRSFVSIHSVHNYTVIFEHEVRRNTKGSNPLLLRPRAQWPLGQLYRY